MISRGGAKAGQKCNTSCKNAWGGVGVGHLGHFLATSGILVIVGLFFLAAFGHFWTSIGHFWQLLAILAVLGGSFCLFLAVFGHPVLATSAIVLCFWFLLAAFVCLASFDCFWCFGHLFSTPLATLDHLWHVWPLLPFIFWAKPPESRFLDNPEGG